MGLIVDFPSSASHVLVDEGRGDPPCVCPCPRRSGWVQRRSPTTRTIPRHSIGRFLVQCKFRAFLGSYSRRSLPLRSLWFGQQNQRIPNRAILAIFENRR